MLTFHMVPNHIGNFAILHSVFDCKTSSDQQPPSNVPLASSIFNAANNVFASTTAANPVVVAEQQQNTQQQFGQPGHLCTQVEKQCLGGAICLAGICVCRPGFRPHSDSSNGVGYCQIAKVELGQPCFINVCLFLDRSIHTSMHLNFRKFFRSNARPTVFALMA